MRNFKKVIAGILAAASVMTCTVLPASAETIIVNVIAICLMSIKI